jgi:ABC-type sugar transport system permease subunit
VLWNSAFLIVTSIRVVDAARLCRRSDPGHGFRWVGLFRTAVFQVWLVRGAVAILWGWIFNSDYRIVNFVLIDVGVLAHCSDRREIPLPPRSEKRPQQVTRSVCPKPFE